MIHRGVARNLQGKASNVAYLWADIVCFTPVVFGRGYGMSSNGVLEINNRE